VTITIIQGQGTALYTPLEQYGGDDTHTDARADIYSFGATLYHILTNEPPAEARRRFLNSRSLVPLREINPAVNSRVERAIMWAMCLHPDERPATIQVFRDALFGSREIPAYLEGSRPGLDSETLSLFNSGAERAIGYGSLALFVLGLLITLMR
jgi:serine/threonine-protein kinase